MVSKKAKQKTARPGGGRVSAVAKLSGTRREPVPPKRGLSVKAADDDAPQLPPKPDTTRGGGERAPLPPKRGLGVGRVASKPEGSRGTSQPGNGSSVLPTGSGEPVTPKPDGSRGMIEGPALPQLPPKPDGTRGGLAPQLPPKPEYSRGLSGVRAPLPPKPDGSLSVGSRGSAH